MSFVSMVKKGLRLRLLFSFPVPLRSCCSPGWCGSEPQCPKEVATTMQSRPIRVLPALANPEGKGRTCDQAEPASSSTIHMSLLGQRDASFAPLGIRP